MPDPIAPDTPTRRKVVINSHTTGKYITRTLGGDPHMITQMVPIKGDTVMNGILYPEEEVAAAYGQFTNLPAPAGHPKVDGKSVSAYHPMAVNAFNVGGFTRNPRREGKKVIVDFYLNMTVAEKFPNGVELMRRIKEGDQVGVSTGLDLMLTAANGKGEDGVDYTAKGSEFQFDHTAVLLDEAAAGAHVGTELILNEELGEDILIGEVADEPVENVTLFEWQEQLREAIQEKFAAPGKRVWFRDFILDESAAIFEVFDEATSTEALFKVGVSQDANGFTIADNPTEVIEKREFVPVSNAEEEEDMELTIENTTAFLENAGKKVVDPSELITPEQVTALSAYAENKEPFEAYMAEQTSVLNTKREECMEASGLKEADVANLGIDAMQTIIDKCTTNINNAARGGGHKPASERSEDANKFAADYMSGKTIEKE